MALLIGGKTCIGLIKFMRLHLIALPHVRLGTEHTHLCAYSGKVEKFLKMMDGHVPVTLYAPESQSNPAHSGDLEFVSCLSDEKRIEIFGKDDPNRLPNWPTDAQTKLFNLHATAELAERVNQKEDIVLLSGGRTHMPIQKALPELMFCEPFCGYFGIFTDKVAFESYAHLHQVYAKEGINDIRWYDRVIPPYADPDDFPQMNETARNRRYLLFIGRLIGRKGPHIALQIARACNLPLVVAGSGGRVEGFKLIGLDVTLESGYTIEASVGAAMSSEAQISYVGPVGIEDRAKLMSNAIAVIAPTTYIEPGGNVAIEAMMAGTPVIAPDCGVFSETIRHRVSGYHFRTLKQAVAGMKWAREEQGGPDLIRAYADSRYSLEAVRPKFEWWFEDLQGLWGKGWDAL